MELLFSQSWRQKLGPSEKVQQGEFGQQYKNADKAELFIYGGNFPAMRGGKAEMESLPFRVL